MPPILALLLGLLTAQVSASPPPQTLQRMQAALERLQDGSQVHSYKVTTRHTWSEEEGDETHVEMAIVLVAFNSRGKQMLMETERLHDGQPVKKPERGPRGARQLDIRLDLPLGDDLQRYAYGPTVNLGLVQTSNFQPAPGVTASKHMVAGKLAWDPLTFEPVWMEFQPMGRDDHYRIDLSGEGDKQYVGHMEHSGEEGSFGYRYSYRTVTDVWEVIWQ